MSFLNFIWHFPATKSRDAVVTFTGGMGAQIISAAIYYLLLSEGRKVYADFSYFDKAEYIAIAGKCGEISHWSWQLEPFGLTIGSFNAASGFNIRDVELVEDGPKKGELAIRALREPAIRERFAIPMGMDDILPAGFSAGYLCIHMRRGDYLNVASHLVADKEFIRLAGKFAGLVKCVVVVSDSPIDEPFRQTVSAWYEQAVFLDNIDAYVSHRIMREARILIGSNSQFSLVAALLSPQTLAVLPKQWFGQNERAVEAPIHEACGFQILDSE